MVSDFLLNQICLRTCSADSVMENFISIRHSGLSIIAIWALVNFLLSIMQIKISQTFEAFQVYYTIPSYTHHNPSPIHISCKQILGIYITAE